MEPLTIYNIYSIILYILYILYIYIISYDYVRNIVRHKKHSERNVKSGTTLESADFLLATVESRRCNTKLHSNRIRTVNSPRHRRYNMSTPIRIRESPHQPSQIISNSLNSAPRPWEKKNFCHVTQRRNTATPDIVDISTR